MKKWKSAVAALCMGLVLSLGGILAWNQSVSAHCQIPCGIYDDAMRFTMLEEHVTTIEKSINQIVDLSKDPAQNANQLTRWVMNKEDHADQFAEIVTWYFLQQRIKPTEARSGDEWDKYVLQIRLCHEMLVATMKAKQTTDLQYTEQLRKLVDEFRHSYFTAEQLAHMKEHT